jgi:hypothetical protein
MISKQTRLTGVILATAGLVAGCSSQGLSSRETGSNTYSELVRPASPHGGMTTYNGINGAQLSLPDSAPMTVNLPARVSVVQVGEIVPPQSMLDSLRGKPLLFCQVSPQSGVFDASNTSTPPERLEQMRTLAQNVGSDYLLVFGGNIDSGHGDTPLSVLNLTILGAFIVPTTAVSVEGRAAGSLVDVKTGRVLMNFSSDTTGRGLAPTLFADGAETMSVATAKTELVKKLTDDVITQMASRTKPITAMVK